MGDPFLINSGLFLGREDEQASFYEILDSILDSKNRGIRKTRQSAIRDWSYVVLIYGVGGMGKTTFSKRLCDTLRGLSPNRKYSNQFRTVWLDWDANRDRDPRLADRESVNFETVIDHLYSAFRESGITKEFDQLQRERTRLADILIRLENALNSHDDDPDRYSALRKLGISGLTMIARASLGTVGTFIPQNETVDLLDRIAKDGATSLKVLAEEWLHHHLKSDEFALFTMPWNTLAQSFADGIRYASRTKPVVVILDTYEIVNQTDPWLRQIMAQSGSRAVWVLSGRDNLVESRKRGDTFLKGYYGEVPAGRLKTFQMQEFSVAEITAYFAQLVPGRFLTHDDAAALHRVTYGIPLAVKTAAAIWRSGVSLGSVVSDFEKHSNREEIAKTITERLLVHAEADTRNPRDLALLYSLGLIYTPDYGALSAMWQTDDIKPILSGLEQRYDFVFAYSMRLHEIFLEFLREYLRGEVERKGPRVQGMCTRAVEHLELRLIERQSTLATMEDRFNSSDWLNDALALTWYRFWVNVDFAWKTWRSLLIASLTYDPSTLGALIDMLRFFAPVAPARSAKWLKDVRMIVRPEPGMASDAMSIDWLEVDQISDIKEPYQGCISEYRAMTAWVRGRLARIGHFDDVAFRFWLDAADEIPPNALGLRKKLSTALGILGDSAFGPSGRTDKAQLAIEYSCKLNPQSGRSWHALGHIYEDQGDVHASLAAFEKARDLDPDRVENWRCVGRCYLKCKDAGRAAEAFRRVIGLEKSDEALAKGWHWLGSAYRAEDKLVLAIEAFNTAITYDANSCVPWNSLADIYLDQGNMLEAITAAERAVSTKGTNKQMALAWLTLGQAYYLDHRTTEDTLAAFAQAALLDNGSPWPWHHRGHVLEKLGQLEEAIGAFRQASLLDPENPNHGNCLKRLLANTHSLPEDRTTDTGA